MTFIKFKMEVLLDPRSIKLNFEPDDRNHYVYRISNKYIKLHYYGSKTEDYSDTIGCGYYTSSNDTWFLSDFKKNQDDYQIKIVRRFNNSADKILFESYLHNRFNVKNHINFINLMNQTPFGFDATGYFSDPLYGEERRLIQSEKTADLAKQKKINDPIGYQRTLDKQQLARQRNLDDPIKAQAIADKISRNSKGKQSGIKHSQAVAVRGIDMITKEIIGEWPYIKQAAEECGIHPSGISHCLNGIKTHYKGSFWERIKEDVK